MSTVATQTVAICSIIRDEAYYLEEWVAFHRKQGITEFRIYDNGSVDNSVQQLTSLGIEPVIWAGQPADFDTQQRDAYKETANMLSGKVAWIAFIDVDEFLFGKKSSLIGNLQQISFDVSAIAVQQRVFGSNGQLHRRSAPVIQRFTRCAPDNHPECLWFKSIVRPEAIMEFDSVHSVKLKYGKYIMGDGSILERKAEHPGEADRRVEGAFGLHHYPVKSLEEFRAKQVKWANRLAASRMTDEYFFQRDDYANAQECSELSELLVEQWIES